MVENDRLRSAANTPGTFEGLDVPANTAACFEGGRPGEIAPAWASLAAGSMLKLGGAFASMDRAHGASNIRRSM